MTVSELLGILWARRARFLTVLFITVALAVTASLLFPKTYVGEVSLVVNSKGTDPLTDMVVPSQLMPSAVATQLDIIASHSVAVKVVDRFKLDTLQEVRDEFRESTEGNGSIRDWFANQLLKKLEVKPARESNVISIRYPSHDPAMAAAFANAFADAYIETSLELNMDPAKRQASWFDTQIEQLRGNLKSAQDKLLAYQLKHNVVATDSRLDVENAKLAEAANQLVIAQSAMYDAQTRQKQMTQALDRGQVEQLPDILGNALLQSMKADLTRSEAKLSEVKQRYGRNHPQYMSASAELETLKGKLAAELETARGSINQTAQIAQKRVVELQNGVEQQKARILRLKEEHDGADTLNREVENAQRAFDAASQRGTDLRLESKLNQSTVAVLDTAVVPAKAEWPKPLLNTCLAIILGTMLGAIVAILSEMLDRRVRSAPSLAHLANLAVIAEIPRVSRSVPKLRTPKGRRRQLAAA